jgi:hypothetical protein
MVSTLVSTLVSTENGILETSPVVSTELVRGEVRAESTFYLYLAPTEVTAIKAQTARKPLVGGELGLMEP